VASNRYSNGVEETEVNHLYQIRNVDVHIEFSETIDSLVKHNQSLAN